MKKTTKKTTKKAVRTTLTSRISPYVSTTNKRWIDTQAKKQTKPVSQIVNDAITTARKITKTC